MAQLIAAYIIEKDEEVFELSFESIKDVADHIIIVDGNHYHPGELPYYEWTKKHHPNVHIIYSPYDHPYIGANGKQRNIYLKYAQQHFPGDWCLVIDGDEVLNVPHESFRKYLEETTIPAYGVHMRHLVYCMSMEDSTVRLHFAPTRLFKITPELYYDEVEHCVLRNIQGPVGLIQLITLWHFGYAREMFRLARKYNNHLEKSNIHTPEYLRQWYMLHLTGKYPISPINMGDLPEIIKKYFMIEDIEDELYFQTRSEPEAKHFIDAWNWKNHFKPERMLEIGCGMGHRVFAAHVAGIPADGFDKSKYAIANTPYKLLKDNLSVRDITKPGPIPNEEEKHDLVVCYDILEHLTKEELEIALPEIRALGNKDYLFSIPFLGDPNLEADPTHKTKESRQWWEETLQNNGFELQPTPETFIFKNQLIIARKK